MWVDGRMMLLPRPTVLPPPRLGADPTGIEDIDGRLRLRFTPVGSKPERRQLGLIAMDYEQFFGRYEGEVTDEDGVVHSVKDIWGALERMTARF